MLSSPVCHRVAALISVLLIVACQPFSRPQTEKGLGAEVIYGEDRRIDYYEIADANWQLLADATASLIDHRDLEWSEEQQSFLIKATTYGRRYLLCPDETFFHQPSAGYCSGFLVGPDLLVTAGHCLRGVYGCENVRFVFGYKMKDAQDSPTQISKQNVFRCQQLIHTETNAVTGKDFALVRLDRSVPVPPLPVRTGGSLLGSESLAVIGYPSGLPLKFADQGEIRNNENPHYLVTNLDTYGGNSGSPVFNQETRLVEGILVRGETDFVYDQASQCRRSKVCLPNNCRGEDVVRIAAILEILSPGDLSKIISVQ